MCVLQFFEQLPAPSSSGPPLCSSPRLWALPCVRTMASNILEGRAGDTDTWVSTIQLYYFKYSNTESAEAPPPPPLCLPEVTPAFGICRWPLYFCTFTTRICPSTISSVWGTCKVDANGILLWEVFYCGRIGYGSGDGSALTHVALAVTATLALISSDTYV